MTARSDARRTPPLAGFRHLALPTSLQDSRTVSFVRRCAKIASVVAYRGARVGWGMAARKLGSRELEHESLLPGQLRLTLEELGPTFVKLGQLFSARSDITPPEIQKELSTLRDHVPSIPHGALVAELERSLGSEPSAHFATLQMAPVACGSIAQVHKALLHDGVPVAVKVRRPGVRSDIDADILLLRKLVQVATRLSSRVRAYDPLAILDEFAALLDAETDFAAEADNLEAVGRTFAANEAIIIPRVFADMSGESVLVMDWIEGVPLNDQERLDEVGANRATLARIILQAYGSMIFTSDRFHADPHPGNLIALNGGTLALVDFGEVGSVDPGERSALLGMITAVLGRDGDALAGAVLAACRTTRPVDRTELGRQLTTLLDPVADSSLETMRLGEVFGRLLHLLRTYGLVLPSDLAILIKTVVECEATAKELDPTASLLSLVGELGAFVPILPNEDA